MLNPEFISTLALENVVNRIKSMLEVIASLLNVKCYPFCFQVSKIIKRLVIKCMPQWFFSSNTRKTVDDFSCAIYF